MDVLVWCVRVSMSLVCQDAQADPAVAFDRPGLAPRGHRGDQQVVAVHHVVNDGHGRAVVLAGIAEDTGAVVSYELPSLCLIHDRTLVSGIPLPRHLARGPVTSSFLFPGHRGGARSTIYRSTGNFIEFVFQ